MSSGCDFFEADSGRIPMRAALSSTMLYRWASLGDTLATPLLANGLRNLASRELRPAVSILRVARHRWQHKGAAAAGTLPVLPVGPRCISPAHNHWEGPVRSFFNTNTQLSATWRLSLQLFAESVQRHRTVLQTTGRRQTIGPNRPVDN